MLKFNNIVEGIFKPATKEDLYNRKVNVFRAQLKSLDDTYGPLKVGDYVCPIDDIHVYPINPKDIRWKNSGKTLYERNIYKVVERSEDVIVFLKAYVKKLKLTQGTGKESHLSIKTEIWSRNIEKQEFYVEVNPIILDNDLNLNVFHKGSLKERFGLDETN